MRRDAGFTLVELMIVVVVIGILAAIAIPNFTAMQWRSREAGLKSNMHTFQISAEDYGVLNDGRYATTASQVVSLVPGGNANFKNSFNSLAGENVAWEDRGVHAGPASAIPGITSYADSNASTYNVKGHTKTEPLSIILSSGY